ncbi:MAG TPA: STAS/SEC14 domain-containing protein [Polyangiaceae bacterium]|jgi:hypothetical protein|nr:STAS/SEC14 domain-containing protein [Polyangiaceae bacterium]
MTDSSEWQAIGNQRVRVEGDTVFSRWSGSPSMAEIQGYHAVLERVLAEAGKVYCLIDMRNSERPSPEARQWMTGWARRFQVTALAGFGANFAMRTVATLMSRAVRFFKSDMPVMEFFETEAEARVYLAAERARIAAKKGSAGPRSARRPPRSNPDPQKGSTG